MLKKLVLDGAISERIGYRLFAYGPNVYERVFYSPAKDDEGERFFSKGYGFSLTASGISYKGNGGSFCNYMFGVERPFKDLVKQEVKNRLTLFGATQKTGDDIEFTDLIAGEHDYGTIFSEGNVSTNYFFIVVSARDVAKPGKRQETILRRLGKALKRTPLVEDEDDESLLDLMYDELGEQDALLLMLKLYDMRVKEYWRLTTQLEMTEEAAARARVLEDKIESYQLERLKVELNYRREENQSLVNEYVSLLIRRHDGQDGDIEDDARIKKLRMVLIRNGIPGGILDNLEKLLTTPGRRDRDEGSKDVTAILENLLRDGTITDDDLIRLLFEKKLSLKTHDMTFEQQFLDIGRAVDEKVANEGSAHLLESFNRTITFFDRFDGTYQLLTKIVFIPDSAITENNVRSLTGNFRIFEGLRPRLFFELFMKDMYRDPYVTSFGRKRLGFLEKQLPIIVEDDNLLLPSLYALKSLMQDEVVFYRVIAVIKQEFWETFSLWGEKEMDMDYYMGRVTDKIKEEMGDDIYISKQLWQEIFWHIKKEVFFIAQVLPRISSEEKSLQVKEDFIANSGMDRFYVEEIERSYLAKHGIKDVVGS